MRKLIVTGFAIALAASAVLAQGDAICSGESAAVYVNTTLPATVDKRLTLCALVWGDVGESATVAVDGAYLFSTTNQPGTTWTWQPRTKGNHTLTCTLGTKVLTKTLNVTAIDFPEPPGPNPPMAKNNSISITPTTRNFGANGGGNSIITSGSGTWTAAVSDSWITLNATSGNVGYPVAYTVSANPNVEQRTGYVYVSGWVHTVTQDGVGGTISPTGTTFEMSGGSGTISVSAANKMGWQARPNVTWISVSPTSGAGAGYVTYHVAPYDVVSTRQGTLTVAGNTFTVFQYGRRMKLDSYRVTKDYEAHVIPITVNALDVTQWSVTPNNTWISVVDAGNGQGGDLVTIAIAENPSYKARTGTVTIGTETFNVTQQGRTALSFNISPTASTASVNGANGMISVTATPDLPWTATSGANWITIYTATVNGSGNGNVVYNASPNPTLSQRTGKVTVTPEKASGMAAKTHTVTQPAAESALSSNGYEFEASGESCSVGVSVASIVQWSIQNTNGWITVNGSTSRVGPGTVVLQAAANNTVYPRSGTVTIAGKTFSVSQKARGVELEYDTKLFETDGGYESISIHPDGNVSWTAVASDPTWITIFQGDSGTGDGEILYIVAPYNGDGSARTGWIEVGDKKVYITQRPYELSIEPIGSVVKGNSGAGEFGVAADIGAVWTAIVTEPWITLVSGYDAGTGSGTVRFICADNNTGKTRTGKIVVAGEVYTVTQSERILVRVQAEAGHGGSLTGSGTYDKGTMITLTAIPDSGYRFVRWTGPVESTVNPLTMDADELTGIRAEFEPLPVEFTSARSSLDGVDLAWNTLAWATSFRLYRGESDDRSAAELLATLANSGTGEYRDGTGERGVTYWYWVEAIGAEDDVVSGSATGMRKPIVNSPITYTNLRGAMHSNPDSYVEGREVTFSHPSAVTGYSFGGWTPSRITEDMTSAQTVRAMWTANRYSIVYNANGGGGNVPTASADYDVEVLAAANGFTKEGHTFAGWATNAEDMAVVFVPGQPMTNLTDVADGRVNMYAVWSVNSYMVAFDANGGTGGRTVTQNYGTALVAPTVTREGYTFKGWSPTVPATVPAGNVTYVAQWTKNSYTVTFDANGGTGGWSRSMAYGSAISAPAVSRTGYTFTGWSPAADASVPAHGVTYMSQWLLNRYEVTFHANGGSGGKKFSDVGGDRTLGYYMGKVSPVRDGYAFDGWWTAKAGGTQVTASAMASGNVTYYAHWRWASPTCSILFHANGGTGGKTLTVNTGAELGDAIAKVSPTRSGYVLDGWWTERTGGTRVGASDLANGDATYYAHWISVPETCKILFHANGGTGGKTFTMAGGAALGSYMAKVSPARDGYVLNGWWTAKSGGTQVSASDIALGDATYYAHWAVVPATCSIFFHANGGTGGKTLTVPGGEELGSYMAKVSPARDGYVFGGWWTARTGGTRISETDTAVGNATYYAQWTAIPATCKIFFHANGGTGGKTLTMPGGAKLASYMDKVSPAHDGYAFGGWWTARTGGIRVGASDIAVGDATYYAHWIEPATCTVFFHANGGTGGKTFAVDAGARFGSYMSKVSPARGGYVFDGWWTARSGGIRIDASDVVVGDVTCYAHWANASAYVRAANVSADEAEAVALANFYGYAYGADGGEEKMLLSVFEDGKATAVVGGDTVYRGELPILSAPDGATLRVVLEGDIAFGFQQ